MFNNKKVHMIGIGGSSMSGIALILKEKGCTITGSDNRETYTTKALQEKGIKVTIGSSKEDVEQADIVIYTAAIPKDFIELELAKKLNKELYERAEFVGKLSLDYENVLCISGTHGKSTTTGMVASCFLEANLNPTIHIGAVLPRINSNSYVGDHQYFIVEACEYVDSFLHFHPTGEIILNIDNDHLEYFKTIDNIKKSFNKFISLLPNDGKLVINNDDKPLEDLIIPENLNVLTYGINKNSNVMAKNISYHDGKPSFDVYYNDELFIHLNLNILGIHNVYNSLSCVALCILYQVDKDAIKKGIESYTGVKRRFEKIGVYQDTILVYDDYAHHPTELESVYNSVKTTNCNSNWMVFEPFTFSRTKESLHEFAQVLAKFDHIVLLPILGGREVNTYDIDSQDIYDLVVKNNPNIYYAKDYSDAVKYLKENLKVHDLVVTSGCGHANEIGFMLLGKNF